MLEEVEGESGSGDDDDDDDEDDDDNDVGGGERLVVVHLIIDLVVAGELRGRVSVCVRARAHCSRVRKCDCAHALEFRSASTVFTCICPVSLRPRIYIYVWWADFRTPSTSVSRVGQRCVSRSRRRPVRACVCACVRAFVHACVPTFVSVLLVFAFARASVLFPMRARRRSYLCRSCVHLRVRACVRCSYICLDTVYRRDVLFRLCFVAKCSKFGLKLS